jgi:AhpD family alkylhydroperoxidase
LVLRLDYEAHSPEGMKALGSVYRYIANCTLEAELIDIVYLRISQINGCSYCIDLHARDAERHGISTRQMLLVSTWREVDLFSDRQRAALRWAELLTRIGDGHPEDRDYEEVKAQFSDREMADLTLAIGVMNAYNRIAIGFGRTPA